MVRSIGGKSSGELSSLAIMMVVVVMAIASPVFGFVSIPTEFDVNLLNLDGSNIDVSLLLTVCYNNDTITLDWECINSVDDPDVITWEIYLGKSNLYGLIPAKDGTDINITVEGYEMIQITAIEDELVIGDYYLTRLIVDPSEFDIVMDRAIAKNGQYVNNRNAGVLHDALEIFNETTPLVVDVRSYPEYAAGHIPGAINIYYRDLGKDSAIAYLDSAYNNHIDAGGKNEIVVYGNTRHLSLLTLAYLRELGKPYSSKAFQLLYGFAAWTANETVAPSRFKECTSFDPVTGKGTAPAGCTSNNFTITLDNPINNSDGTHGGQGWAEVNTGSRIRYEIIQWMWDARFGDMSKPEYRMTAAELYDLLDDDQDGVIQSAGDDLSNDPYILSNRGTTWTSPFPPGPYYTVGHIPSATAVDWAGVVSGSNKRQELRSLNRSDFLPPDRLIVHHCWVGISQQYGGFWYNMLNYTVLSLDWGMWSWTFDPTLRAGGNINPGTLYPQPGDPDDYPFDSLPPDTTPPANVTTMVEQRLDYKSNVTWTPVTDSESGIREYNIYQRVNGSPSTDTLIVTVFAGYNSSPSQPYVAGPGYDDGNFYQYMVTAVDNAGNEGVGAYAPEPSPPPLDMTPPPNVTTTVEQRLDYTFNITWTPVEDDDSGLWGYRIYLRLNDDPGTDALIAGVFAGYNSSPSQPYVAGPGYDDGNLYQYKVTAVDNSGNEGGGAYAPPEGPVPPIPFVPLGTLLTLSSGLVAYGYYRRKTH